MKLLCSIKVKKKDSIFHEEYYFSQLLSHLILIYLKEHPDDKLYSVAKGIIFDSTQNENGTNFVIPALYSDKKPPKSGQSQMIKELLKEQNLTIYRRYETPTT